MRQPRTAVNNTESKKVGVIATTGTVNSRAYEKEIKKLDPDITTYSAAAPELIEYVERGILEGRQLENEIMAHLKPLLDHHIDVLVLGCTHFPLIEEPILKVSGNNIKVISSAVETAGDVKRLLSDRDMEADINNKTTRVFYETAQDSNFFKTGQMFLGRHISDVKKIQLDIH